MTPAPTPRVLLHGFAGSPESWTEVLDELPEAPRLTPTLLGHGDPGPGEDVRDFEGEAERLATEVQNWNQRPVALTGYSLGGRLALALTLRHPNRVRSLTLIGAHPGLDAAQRAPRAKRDEAWARRLETDGLSPFLDAWESQPLFASQSAAARKRQRRRRQGLRPEGLAQALRTLSPARMPDYRPRLGELRLPVTLVTGALDDKFCKVAAEMSAALPRARHRVVPAVGHNVVLEAPSAVAAILTEGETT